MALSSTSLRRPVAMTCLLIALTFLGANDYRKMGLELMPKVDAPYITVVTVWPGATPKDLETDVAQKIEDAVSAVDGLKHVTRHDILLVEYHYLIAHAKTLNRVHDYIFFRPKPSFTALEKLYKARSRVFK